MTEKEALEKAIEVAGSQEALAEALSAALNRRIRQPHIAYMKRIGKATPKMAEPIERVTGISRHELRPDIYPRQETAA